MGLKKLFKGLAKTKEKVKKSKVITQSIGKWCDRCNKNTMDITLPILPEGKLGCSCGDVKP